MTGRLAVRAAAFWCVVFSLVAMLAAGCGKDRNMQPTITLAEATERVERSLRDAAAQLPAGAELKREGPDEPLPCEGAGGMDTGQVFMERSYHVIHPEPWPTDQLIEILDRYWKSQGFRVLRDDRGDRLPATLVVRDSANQVDVAIDLYHRGGGSIDAYLVADSDCIWPDGTLSPRS
ncbi:MAG: hypothetical protein HKP61_12580 [Dactylosporangium sp.]|nr:hypothetical protein [Dactylosporangium sp.]NNJ61755.1 hypothetical protein [Dactylosporangium sp.]